MKNINDSNSVNNSYSNNPKDTVIIGPYTGNVDSYEQIAFRNGNTFFLLGTEGWNLLVQKLKDSGVTNTQEIMTEAFRINITFLNQQIEQHKEFQFTRDPRTFNKGEFCYHEYKYLLKNGYQLILINGKWGMKR